jgi:predicted dithiol-disulfide oxidoreductase (DUF899 family)
MGTHKDAGYSPFGSNATRANVANYTFTTPEGAPTHLADLFGEHDDLLVIHNMGERCQYCALWADGISAFAPQLSRRAALVLATPNDPASARNQIATRGWKFRVVCDGGSSFARDMGFEGESISHGTTRLPGVSAFRRERDSSSDSCDSNDGGVRITRVGAAQFGPGDEFCSIWGLFDLLTGGVRGWAPQAPFPLPS